MKKEQLFEKSRMHYGRHIGSGSRPLDSFYSPIAPLLNDLSPSCNKVVNEIVSKQ